MSLIDHDLDQENLLDPLDLTLVPFTGYEVTHHCPICHTVRLREYPQEQINDDGTFQTVGFRWECPKCKRFTRYYRDMETAAAVKGWVK